MRFAAAVWRRADAMAIDLDKLADVANRKGDREVVSRRWLRQVLKELTEARAQAPALDLDQHPLPQISVFVRPLQLTPPVPSCVRSAVC